jgi:hypothetical protein
MLDIGHGCGRNGMMLELSCGDDVYRREKEVAEEIEEGRFYIALEGDEET